MRSYKEHSDENLVEKELMTIVILAHIVFFHICPWANLLLTENLLAIRGLYFSHYVNEEAEIFQESLSD